MFVVFRLAFKIVMLFVGIVLVYTVVTMFPDEEDRLQNGRFFILCSRVRAA